MDGVWAAAYLMPFWLNRVKLKIFLTKSDRSLLIGKECHLTFALAVRAPFHGVLGKVQVPLPSSALARGNGHWPNVPHDWLCPNPIFVLVVDLYNRGGLSPLLAQVAHGRTKDQLSRKLTLSQLRRCPRPCIPMLH